MPVIPSIINPAAEEYVPPVVPVKLTFTGAELVQKGPPAYKMVADGAAFMVTVVEDDAVPPQRADPGHPG